MKKLFLGLLAVSALMACKPSGTTDTGKADTTGTTTTVNANAPVMKFEFDSHDFGKVKAGDKVTYEFNFTNTGASPLIITNATATCGCTVPEWPKEPIQPGKGGKIKVTFDSANKEGLQDKQITVTANTNPAQNIVHLVGEVLTK
jgi:plastocyanin